MRVSIPCRPSRKLALSACLIASLAWSWASSAKPVVGETHRTTTQPSAAVRDAQHRSELRVTIWYPAKTGSLASPLEIGPPGDPIFRVGSVAADAPFADGPPGERHPVILLSHGFGGTARVMGWFGIAMAAEGYVVIAVDHPGNNGIDPMTVPGATLWWERAEDLKRAFDVIENDPELGPHMDKTRVGAAGFSAGGFTALVLGGARVNRTQYLDFCHSHPDDGVCRPQVEFSVTEADFKHALEDPAMAAIEAHGPDDHSLPAIKAVFAMAPALVQALTPESLRAIKRPVTIVAGEADTVAPPDTNARVAAKAIPNAQLRLLPKAGHYAFLSTCTAFGIANVPVCAQAGPQDHAHRLAIDEAKALFGRTL